MILIDDISASTDLSDNLHKAIKLILILIMFREDKYHGYHEDKDLTVDVSVNEGHIFNNKFELIAF